VPLVPALREGGDDGRPIMAVDPGGETAQAFVALATWIDEHRPTKRRSSALKVG
jgi:ATP-binding protein involved in chromosome partitioning